MGALHGSFHEAFDVARREASTGGGQQQRRGGFLAEPGTVGIDLLGQLRGNRHHAPATGPADDLQPGTGVRGSNGVVVDVEPGDLSGLQAQHRQQAQGNRVTVMLLVGLCGAGSVGEQGVGLLGAQGGPFSPQHCLLRRHRSGATQGGHSGPRLFHGVGEEPGDRPAHPQG